jgi:carboxymethylenebutenolidase
MRRMRWIILPALLGLLVTFAPAQEAEGKKEQAKPKPKKESTETGLTGVLSEEGFKALHELTAEKRPKPRGKMIDVGDMKAYLSLPKGKPPFPAVVVIHEWWGLNEHIRFWADRLAADGYAALAVDLYEGKVATNSDDALKYMRSVDKEKALARLKSAYRLLASDERIQAKKRGCVGWCFGGGWSLQLALNAPDLDAAVIYYGRLETDPEKLAAIKARLLCVFGNRDKSIPPAVIAKFDQGLTNAGVKHEILRYDAHHAFANPSGGRYDQKAAEDAWKKVRAFFAETLKGK